MLDPTGVTEGASVSQALVSLGISGALLASVIVPALRWIMAESTAQRLGFMKFLEDHANQELQILTRMETASLRIEAALAELAAQSRKSQQEVSWRTRQPKVERE